MRFLLAVLSLFGEEGMTYGSWKSPITAEMIANGGVKLGGVAEVDGAIYVGEMRPTEQGRTAVVRIMGDKVEEMLPMPYNARTTVHEYGGKSLVFAGETIYFSNFKDQQVYRREAQGKIAQLTNEKNTRFADGCYDKARNLIYFVVEVQGKEIENCLGAVDLKTGKMRKIAQGADFYASPRLSSDGKQLAYYSWNNPNMPWDGGELRVADLKGDGTIAKEKVIAGGPKESICQIAWGPDGSLYYVSDRSGWWNLYCNNKPLCPMEAEFGQPLWTLGGTTFDFWGKDQIVCSYTQNGFSYLAVLPISGGALKTLSVPFTTIRNPSVTGDNLYFVGSSSDIPAVAVQYNLKKNDYKVLRASSNMAVEKSYFSKAKSIEFPTENNRTAYALYYPPKNPNYKEISGELPPLIVISHGGPTSQALPQFDPGIQYWTSRGVAVIDVNYGGSTGYGRAYRDRLIDTWGIVDVDDCVNAALYCCKQGLADRNRLAITGASAGGFTTLAALTFRDDIFRVGASLFGVSDLEALAKHTHKFEAKYLDSLVGPYPERRDLYIERSPIHHVDQIKSPIILLQGDEDAIVPPSQSELMYQSLLKRGIPTAYVLFKNEQHGFRQAKNIQRSVEAEAYFFANVLGFKLADKIEPVEIKNL